MTTSNLEHRVAAAVQKDTSTTNDILDAITTVIALENRLVRMIKDLEVTVAGIDGKLGRLLSDTDDMKQALLDLSQTEAVQQHVDELTQQILANKEKLAQEQK